jgi:hypothetical protein
MIFFVNPDELTKSTGTVRDEESRGYLAESGKLGCAESLNKTVNFSFEKWSGFAPGQLAATCTAK